MHLLDLLPTADDVLALSPEELGGKILRVLNGWPMKHEACQLSAFINATMVHPKDRNFAAYPAHRQAALKEAICDAWAWLKTERLLIQNRAYGDGVESLSGKALRLLREMDQEQLSKSGGGPLSPGYGDALSLNFRANTPPLVSDVLPQAPPPPAQKPAELLTLKPQFMGMSIDLKELGRRGVAWWRGLRR
jgi:hypothetical protein